MGDRRDCVCVGGRDSVVVRLLKPMLPERAQSGDYADSRCKNNAAKTGEFNANASMLRHLFL